MIRYYWGRFWPFLLFAFGIEAVENLFTVFFEYRNMDFGLLPLLKTAYVFVTEFAVTMCYWLIPYAVYLWILPRGKAGGNWWITLRWMVYLPARMLLVLTYCRHVRIWELRFRSS